MQYAASDVNHHDRYKILIGLRAAAPHRLGDDARPDRRGQCRAVQLLQCLRRGSAARACSPSTSGRTGVIKDTWLNIERTGEFVVNLTDEPLARAMHESSGDFPPDIGEPDYLGLKLAPSVDISRRAWPTRRGRWSARPGRSSTSRTTASW